MGIQKRIFMQIREKEVIAESKPKLPEWFVQQQVKFKKKKL